MAIRVEQKTRITMATNPIALQKVSEDGKYRLTVHYDECADHPLRNCDFPLHMDDWCRDYSANPTSGTNREHYDSREACMRDLVATYGDRKKVLELLKDNGKKQFHAIDECALMYDRSRRAWLLQAWSPGYRHSTWEEKREPHWDEVECYDCKEDDLDLYSVAQDLTEETLSDVLTDCMTDEVKVMSYGFHYYGEISFYSRVDADSEGIAWLVKSEATKDWLTEEQWATKDCYELSEGEREEICAWAEGNVFWFEVEKAVRWQTHRECLSEEREPEDYEETEWERMDSCGGFYGLDYAVQYAIECNQLPKMLEAA